MVWNQVLYFISLMQSRLMIQGFNQGGQRALSKVHIDLYIDDMESSILLHVIDARITYNILLGHPWIYKNMVVPSILHQCFKYYKNGEVRRVMVDTNPFNEAESHYADAKFYFEAITDDEIQVKVDSENQLKEELGKKGIEPSREAHSFSTESGEEKKKVQKQHNNPMQTTSKL